MPNRFPRTRLYYGGEEIQLERNKTFCPGNHCGRCCAGGCGGCAARELSPGEIELLERFARLAFLPVVSASDKGEPVLPGDGDLDAQTDAILALTEKRLIQVDYDIPLGNFDYSPFAAYPIHGSMALTLQGQEILDELCYQGMGALPDAPEKTGGGK